MHSFFDKVQLWSIALRAYSLPISVMSWLIPFIYASLNGGNILLGFIALIGIITLHLATNIFDDTIDYTRGKYLIDKGFQSDFNFQNNKCACIFEGKLNIQQYYTASFILFFISFLIALFFIYICGLKILLIVIPTVILCIFYPVLGSLGLGEVIVAVVFSPLLYSGVFYIMKGDFSLEIFLISISTGLLSVAVLHNHMLLDYKLDVANRKTTLCNICKSQKNAYILLVVIILLSYINIILSVILKKLDVYYLLTLLSLPTAITLFKTMNIHIKNPDEKIKPNFFMGNINEIYKLPENQQSFLLKFLIVRNLLSNFTALTCISILMSNFI